MRPQPLASLAPLLTLPLALACGDKDGDDSGAALDAFPLDVAMSEVIPTVATVSWSWTDSAVTEAHVEFGLGEAFDLRAPVDLSGGTDFSTVVVGMKPGQEYQVRVHAETADGPVVSDVATVTTGNAPSWLPTVTVEDIDPASHHGGFYVTSIAAAPAAVILDADGDYVWWYQPKGEITLLARAVLSRDGTAMLMADVNQTVVESNPIWRVSLDGTEVELIDIPWRHHDFLEHVDGTIAAQAYDRREVDGDTIDGDQLVERSPDGTIRQVSTVWDWHDYSVEAYGNAPFWPHANALEYLPEDDSYLVSYLTLEGIASIDRATGTEQWMLGGQDSTMRNAENETRFFDVQHQMQKLDEDTLLVFVNGTGAGASPESRAVEIDFDPEAHSAELTWEYRPDPSLVCQTLGDVHRFEDGHTLITFSYNGVIVEIDDADQPVWSLSTSLGGAMGYLTWTQNPNDH